MYFSKIVHQQGAPDVAAEYGEIYDYEHAFGDDTPPTSVSFKEEFQRILFYQLSSPEVNILFPSAIYAFKEDDKFYA
jgi:hypothetical protein